VERIREWLMLKLNNKVIISHLDWQKGCPGIIPGLKAKPWWDVEEFPWIKTMEDNKGAILEELLSLKEEGRFQPYRAPTGTYDKKAEDGVGSEGTDKGKWNVFYLYLHDMPFQDNIAKCPKTNELITSVIPRHYHHAFFSAMITDTHIPKHYGPTNKKLRFHLPLIGVEGSRLRVADETRELKLGKVRLV